MNPPDNEELIGAFSDNLPSQCALAPFPEDVIATFVPMVRQFAGYLDRVCFMTLAEFTLVEEKEFLWKHARGPNARFAIEIFHGFRTAYLNAKRIQSKKGRKR